MKHSAPLFKILSGCVLVGVLLLFGLQLWQYFSNPLTTTLVYKAETEVTISTDGWVVREEEGFHTDGGTLIHALREGEKVGVGQLLASKMPTNSISKNKSGSRIYQSACSVLLAKADKRESASRITAITM